MVLLWLSSMSPLPGKANEHFVDTKCGKAVEVDQKSLKISLTALLRCLVRSPVFANNPKGWTDSAKQGSVFGMSQGDECDPHRPLGPRGNADREIASVNNLNKR